MYRYLKKIFLNKQQRALVYLGCEAHSGEQRKREARTAGPSQNNIVEGGARVLTAWLHTVASRPPLSGGLEPVGDDGRCLWWDALGVIHFKSGRRKKKMANTTATGWVARLLVALVCLAHLRANHSQQASGRPSGEIFAVICPRF